MTKIITSKDIKEAAECIKNGGIVAFPTETVYGLGGDAFNTSAIDKIYKAKGRPSDNPLIVHICCQDDLDNLVTEVSKNAKLLIDNFWPGPLTIILPKKKSVPYRVTGGLDTVAVRLPEDPVAIELIKLSNTYIAAPSANLSGSPSPTTSRHVIADLNGRVDYILTGDDSKIGLESTVIDLTSEVPLILRPGAITLEMIKKYIPEAKLDIAVMQEAKKPRCPGMKYKHYSPKANVEVVCGTNKESIREYISNQLKHNESCGVMTYKGGDYDDAVCVLSSGNTMEQYASSLFYNLRVFDEYGVSKIYAEFINEEGMGIAVKNRLFKAAGNNITEV